jgi:hypothetical protein
MLTSQSQLVPSDPLRASLDFFDQDVAPEVYTEERRGDHFQNSLKRERNFNIPYWAKVIASSAPSEREELIRRSEKAVAVINDVMVANGGKFEDWKVRAYLQARERWLTTSECSNEEIQRIALQLFKEPNEIKKALLHIERAFEACGHLRIRFQSLVKSPLPEHELILTNADEAVRNFRHMEMDLPKGENSKQIWQLFQKAGMRPGSKFVWTKVPARVTGAFKMYARHGLKATFQGVPGNYVVTLAPRCPPKNSNAAPKKPSPDQFDLNKWQWVIRSETLTNNPYWSKYFSGLPIAEREALIQACKRATKELFEILASNRGLFTQSQFAKYELGTDPDRRVTRAIAACEQLRIPVQIMVAGPISKKYLRTSTEFRALDLDSKPCKSIGDLVRYFRGKAPGETAVLTGGPPERNRVHSQAMARGLAVGVEGAYGNRLVTFKDYDDTIKSKVHGALITQRDLSKDDYLISNRHTQLVEGGPSVYVEGCKSTLYRQLNRYFGAKSCSIFKNGKGWDVKLLRITNAKEK